MLNFTCEVNERYTFHTTSVIKLMKFLYRNDRMSEFLITVAADKDSGFIEKFLVPTDLQIGLSRLNSITQPNLRRSSKAASIS